MEVEHFLFMKAVKFLTLTIFLGFIFRLFVLNNLAIANLSTTSFFIFDLLGKSIIFPWWVNLILGLVNIILIWFITKKIFSSRVALFSALIYAISPWTVFVELSGTSYVFLLFIFLLLALSVILKDQKNELGAVIMSFSVTTLLLSSIFSWVILPILFIGTLATGVIKQKKAVLVNFILVNFILVGAVTTILIVTNREAFKNHLNNQLTILSDVGIINTVNTFRGENQKANFSVGKVAENRYGYFSQKLFVNFLDTLTPTIYFTPQAKLLNFAFTPPIFLGLLFPFIFGLVYIFKLFQKYRGLILSLLILVIPSVFSKSSPDLTRLIIFSPFLFIITGLGLENFYINRKHKVIKFLITLSIILLVFQIFVTIQDIFLREPIRLQKFR